jgi:hypothetical protein
MRSVDHAPALGPAVPGTRMPWTLALGLVALGLPRTILSDLGVLAPESSAIYYLVALLPFAAWLAVAVLRSTASPIRDQLAVGLLYAVSLIIVHELLWNADASVGHHPPQAALRLGAAVDPPLDRLVVHGYAGMIALMIGLGVALVAGLAGTVARLVRDRP